MLTISVLCFSLALGLSNRPISMNIKAEGRLAVLLDLVSWYAGFPFIQTGLDAFVNQCFDLEPWS